MSHNDRPFRSPVLPPHFVPTPSFLRRLDQAASESLNGDGGGLWSPSAPIIIGGAGAALSSLGGFTGGIATGQRSLPGALLLGDGDYPTFSTPRTRTVVFPICDFLNTFVDANNATSIYDQSTSGALLSTGSNCLLNVRLDSKRFPVGATIASVTLRFTVGAKPAAVPGTLQEIQFFSELVHDDATLTAANVDAYFNAGRPQNLQVVPVNNATVTAGHCYYLLISDQTNTLCRFHSIAIAFTNLVDMRPGF